MLALSVRIVPPPGSDVQWLRLAISKGASPLVASVRLHRRGFSSPYIMLFYSEYESEDDETRHPVV